MAKYRKKSITVLAEQWDPDSLTEQPGVGVPDKHGVVWQYDTKGTVWRGVIVDAPNKDFVYPGYWIVTDVKRGQIFAIDPETFEQTHEKVED
jgi:hypothetical protein